MQFLQTPQLIVILVESRHVFRLIPMNAKHPGDLDPSYLGDLVGHWEGDTLVVDVTAFKEQLTGPEIHTDAWHVVERYTRVDYNTINYQATLEDPEALTRPWTIQSKSCCTPAPASRNMCAKKIIRTRRAWSNCSRMVWSPGNNGCTPARYFSLRGTRPRKLNIWNLPPSIPA